MTSIISHLCAVTIVAYSVKDEKKSSIRTFLADEAAGFIKGIEEASDSTVKNITAIFTRTVVVRENYDLNHSIRTVVIKNSNSANFIHLCQKAEESIFEEEWCNYMKAFFTL